MYAPTKNPYKFKYLITGISGPGIEQVYLPEQPADDQILFKAEQKFTRPAIPDYLQEWMNEYEVEREHNPDFIHAHQAEINEWEEREFERCQAGVWFWNDGVATYLTGDNYKFLTQWQPLFGFPDYWEADKEIWYWIAFWEEDPRSFGGALNTSRRTGKSTKMGFWIMNRTSTNFKHLAGMQGEDDTKIRDFYEKMVIDPFYKMPYYSKPTYDTTTLQKKGIIFKDPPKRNKRRILSRSKVVLESQMDYRTSEANKYDQAKLHSYVGEEFGKLKKTSVIETWKFIKRCFLQGIIIIGKAFLGTTVEFMDVTDKGGKAYKKLCLSSDYNKRDKLDRTTSGLYAALMPGDCILEGFIDTHGRPIREQARQYILDERESVEDNPKDYADLIRKYPLNWNEVFYISAEKCEFNAKILQDRKNEILMNPPPLRKVKLSWENNKRFSRIIVTDDSVSGWLEISSLIDKDKWNNVGEKIVNGQKMYYPKNNGIFRFGVDPIDHGVQVESLSVNGEDAFMGKRRSLPVMIGKRLYDSAIDGPLTQDLLEQRAKEKYKYKTGVHVAIMKTRPSDPNVFFERVLQILWLFSCTAGIESQKPGVINWLRSAGCREFIANKFVPDVERMKKTDFTEGTATTPVLTQELTSSIATDVEYFGHTYPFIEVIEDDLLFDPAKTREFDFTMAQGHLEINCKTIDKAPPIPVAEITDFFHTFNRHGMVTD